MHFQHPLIEARLVKRYKRFLADVEMENGEVITVHCPNPGSMLGLKDPGSRVWISDSHNPKRKLRHTLEVMEVENTLVGINTNLPNTLAVEALETGLLSTIVSYESLKREVKYGENSRIDILLDGETPNSTYVEVKNVHLVRKPGLHEFPDSVTARGAKHLGELSREVEQGHRAIMLFVVQRDDGDIFRLARDIDPRYGEAYDNAINAGVEAYCIKCKVDIEKIIPYKLIEIDEKKRDNPHG